MSSSPARPELSDDDDFETEIVGESFRQDELHELASRVDVDNQGRRTFVACLRPEPENTHDKNAVAVLANDNGAHLGYLSRDTAPTYHHALLQCGSAEVPAILFGGNERKPHIGVWLDLTALNRTLGIESPSVAVRQAIALSSAAALRLIQPAQKASGSALDPHGQPLNISFNRARRAERDLCQLLGLARGLIADGNVTETEASLLRDWVPAEPDASHSTMVPVVQRERFAARGRHADRQSWHDRVKHLVPFPVRLESIKIASGQRDGGHGFLPSRDSRAEDYRGDTGVTPRRRFDAATRNHSHRAHTSNASTSRELEPNRRVRKIAGKRAVSSLGAGGRVSRHSQLFFGKASELVRDGAHTLNP